MSDSQKTMVTDTTFAMNVAPVSPSMLSVGDKRSKLEERMDRDEGFKKHTIHVAERVPDARGLEEIRDPFLKAKVADALDMGRDPQAMFALAKILDVRYPQAADRVLKQAKYLQRMAEKVW